MRSLALIIGLLLVHGCPSPLPQPQPVPPDAADASPPLADGAPFPPTPAGNACENLRAVGCSEGMAANCVAVLEHNEIGHLVNLNLPCLASKKTKEEIRQCSKSIICP